jgi:hypothetical protein
MVHARQGANGDSPRNRPPHTVRRSRGTSNERSYPCPGYLVDPRVKDCVIFNVGAVPRTAEARSCQRLLGAPLQARPRRGLRSVVGAVASARGRLTKRQSLGEMSISPRLPCAACRNKTTLRTWRSTSGQGACHAPACAVENEVSLSTVCPVHRIPCDAAAFVRPGVMAGPGGRVARLRRPSGRPRCLSLGNAPRPRASLAGPCQRHVCRARHRHARAPARDHPRCRRDFLVQHRRPPSYSWRSSTGGKLTSARPTAPCGH